MSWTDSLTTLLVVNRDVTLCLGQHGSIRLLGGGERDICGRRFKAQPAAMLKRWKRLEHTAAELSGHSGREQVGLWTCFYPAGQLRIFFHFLCVFLPPQWCCCRGQSGQDIVSVLFLWATSASSHPTGYARVSSPLLCTLCHGSDFGSDALGLVSALLVYFCKLQLEASSVWL